MDVETAVKTACVSPLLDTFIKIWKLIYSKLVNFIYGIR